MAQRQPHVDAARSPAASARRRDTSTGAASIANDAQAGLAALLKLEAEVRAAASLASLRFLIAAETRRMTRAGQVLVFAIANGKPRLVTISGLPAVDRTAPLVSALEGAVSKLSGDGGLRTTRTADLAGLMDDHMGAADDYPFRCMSWLPFNDRDGNVSGGMLLLRGEPWQEHDLVIAERLAGTYAHALEALRLRARPRLPPLRAATVSAALGLFALAGLAIPVPLTTLAPFEIAPENAFVVAAPIDGTLDQIVVDPNAEVREGDILIRFADTALKNRLEIATRELGLAETRLKKSTQLAFTDVRGRQDLAIAMSEVELKIAERDAARDLLDRAVVRAPRAGIAVFADKKQLAGKPVAVGERIMLIADPARVEVAIDVAVADAIVLRPGARTKVFLDSDPLHPREAIVASADHRARVRPGGQLAFRVTARLTAGAPTPRLGVRGTAQIYGDEVSLAFALFRRPLAVLRQWTGL